MPDSVIQVANLSKQYVLPHQAGADGRHFKYKRFSDALITAATSPFRARDGNLKKSSTRELFWALNDVSFEIRRGEVVGIIGRNGAGKSTLLKILSRITEPTAGRVEIQGRAASLLEVGTGFHPELTGRENIYLNGAILGMKRAEIKKKFDEIVAFAEVDKFLDTPVKHYSSGMYVRLAFSVAAHLEPEILIVDEVLAVGDVQFQKKCIGKMQDVSTQEGRTVLFVSHNLTAVQTLCGTALYLKAGRLVGQGSSESQITEYLKDAQSAETMGLSGQRKLGPLLSLNRFTFSPNPVSSGKPVEFSLQLEATGDVRLNEMAILIYSNFGVRTAILDLRPHGIANFPMKSSCLSLSGILKSLPLVEGDYQVGLFISTDTLAENFLDLVCLTIVPPANQVHVPYPVVHRGLVELDFSITMRSEVAGSLGKLDGNSLTS